MRMAGVVEVKMEYRGKYPEIPAVLAAMVPVVTGRFTEVQIRSTIRARDCTL